MTKGEIAHYVLMFTKDVCCRSVRKCLYEKKDKDLHVFWNKSFTVPYVSLTPLSCMIFVLHFLVLFTLTFGFIAIWRAIPVWWNQYIFSCICSRQLSSIWPCDLGFDQTWPIFKLVLDIIMTNILTKFQAVVAKNCDV